MPVPAERPPQLRGGAFRGSAAVAAGLLTRRQLDGPTWRRLFRDVYADAQIPVTVRLRCQAARLVLPDGALISGVSAAMLWGVPLTASDDVVEVVSPTPLGPIHGMRIRVSDVSSSCATTYHGLRICTPIHVAWEIAATRAIYDAIGWVDALARRRRISPTLLVAHGDAHPAARHRRRAEATLRLADPRAESPPESIVRAAFALGGLPTPVPQYIVTNSGYFVARVDLAWPEYRFAIEYDGQWHADRDQLTRDRRRTRALNAIGRYVYPVTRDDLADLDALVRAVTIALNTRRHEMSSAAR